MTHHLGVTQKSAPISTTSIAAGNPGMASISSVERPASESFKLSHNFGRIDASASAALHMHKEIPVLHLMVN